MTVHRVVKVVYISPLKFYNSSMAVVQLSLDAICRSCLSRDNLQPLRKSRRVETLSECVDMEVCKIVSRIFTPVLIHPNYPFQIRLSDGLPTKICSDCWDQCAKWALFKQQFRKNDATLRGLLLFSLDTGSSKEDEPLVITMDEDDDIFDKMSEDEEDPDPLQITLENNIETPVEEVVVATLELTDPEPPVFVRSEAIPNRSSSRKKVPVSKEPSPNRDEEESADQNEPEPEYENNQEYVTTANNSRALHLTCNHCDKKFRKPDMLEAHMRAVQGKKVS